MTQAQQIISRAYNILSAPKAWSKGASSRNAKGVETQRNAVSWCLAGALNKALNELPASARTNELLYQVFMAVRNRTKQKSIIVFNDHPKTLKKDVLAVLKEAEKLCGNARKNS